MYYEGLRQVDIKEKITCIASGHNFYMVVTDNGKTYGWGLNEYGQTGDFTRSAMKCREPREVKLPGKIIGNSFLFKTHF